MFEQAGGYLAERVTDLRSVRDRVVARADRPARAGGARAGPPVGDRRPGPRSRRHRRARPGQRPRDRHRAGRTDRPHRDHRRAARACRAWSACAGATALRGRRRTSRSTPPPAPSRVDPDDARRAELDRRAAVEAALASDTAPGGTADGRAVALLANIGTAEDAARVAGGRVEGVGLFRTEVLFLDEHDRADAGGAGGASTRACCARSAAARSSSARSTPVPTSRWRSPRSPTRRTRRSACAATALVRTHPELLDTQLAALARAAAGDRRRRRGSWRRWSRRPPRRGRSPTRARAAGVATVGVMIEVPAAALRAPRDPRRGRLRVPRHQRPRAVHDGDRPAARRAGRPARPVAAGRARPRRRDRARPGSSARKPVGVCGESATDPLLALVLVGLGRDQPVDVRRGGPRRPVRAAAATRPRECADHGAPPRSRHRRLPRGAPRSSSRCTRTCARRLGV